jgi:hypothetical protein
MVMDDELRMPDVNQLRRVLDELPERSATHPGDDSVSLLDLVAEEWKHNPDECWRAMYMATYEALISDGGMFGVVRRLRRSASRAVALSDSVRSAPIVGRSLRLRFGCETLG